MLSQSIQLIIILNNIITKNGKKEIDKFLIEFIQHISHKIKLKMPTVVLGQPISLN